MLVHLPRQEGYGVIPRTMNGLLRQYFPKGTELSRWSDKEIETVAGALNNRPRGTLGWKTPTEALNDQPLSVSAAGVATTG
jgi:IS30 family transposase